MTNAVSLARTTDTPKLCAARSFSRNATMTRPVRDLRTLRTATYTSAATTTE